MEGLVCANDFNNSTNLCCHLCQQDLEQSGNNVKSHYFLRFYGDFKGVRRDDETYHINYLSHKTHKSFITLQFSANDVTFVEHRSPGRIVQALIEDFLALSGSGFLTVVIQNTGRITSDYTVSFVSSGPHNSVL